MEYCNKNVTYMAIYMRCTMTGPYANENNERDESMNGVNCALIKPDTITSKSRD